MENKGKLIVIEGIDGSGKATQVEKLSAKITGICTNRVNTYSFPRYHTSGGQEIKRYLQGFFGNPVRLDPRLSFQLFSADRRKAKHIIERDISEREIVLCDRYTGSNLAHQGAKLPPEQREEFARWGENYEFNILKIPKPDLTILLNIPPKLTMQAIESQGREKDRHESDFEYQKKVRETYLWLAEKPDWKTVECMNGNNRKTIDEIAEDILKHITHLINTD